jgi:hypothetical protein
MAETRWFGALGQFESPRELYRACERVRDAGFRIWDAHSPFPVHGLDRAMGLRRSRLPFLVIAAALAGAAGAFGLQAWIHTIDYPLVFSGKPLLSWPAFVPVVFEVTILFAAFGAVLGMFRLCKLPRHYHSLFRSRAFERVTDDKFFISIEAADPRFDSEGTLTLLRELGASHVELVKD